MFLGAVQFLSALGLHFLVHHSNFLLTFAFFPLYKHGKAAAGPAYSCLADAYSTYRQILKFGILPVYSHDEVTT